MSIFGLFLKGKKPHLRSEEPVVTTRDILYLLATILTAIIALTGLLPLIGNKPQTFNDYTIGYVARNNQNITGELGLFWGITIALSVILAIACYRVRKHQPKSELNATIGVELVLTISTIFYYIINSQLCIPLVLIGAFLVLCEVFSKHKLLYNAITLILIYYALQGLNVALTFLNIPISISMLSLQLLAVITSIVLLGIIHDNRKLKKVILLIQFFIPLLLLATLQKKYQYGTEIIKIDLPVPYLIVQSSIIIISYISLIVTLVLTKHRTPSKIAHFCSVASIVVIALCNSNPLIPKQILDDDLQHHPENTISFNQITELDMEIYTDYTPTSGLYSVVQGLALESVGDGLAQYYLAEIILNEFVVIITVLLLVAAFNKKVALLLGALFSFCSTNPIIYQGTGSWPISTDRSMFILPCLLLLAIPKLIKKRPLWLCSWALSCLFLCLYYTSLGAAFSIATLPFALMQLYRFFKTDWRECRKKISFWLTILPPVGVVLSFLPLAIRLLKHIKIYANQTKLGDGIAIFGEAPYDNFMSYLPNAARTILYPAVRYTVVISVVLISILVFIIVIRQRKRSANHQLLFLSLSIPIMAVVAFASTIVQNDTFRLISRTRSIVVPISASMLTLIVYKYFKKTTPKFILLSIIISLSLLFMAVPFTAPLKTANIVQYLNPEEASIITDEDRENYPKIGYGFITKDNLATLKTAKEELRPYLDSGLDLKYALIGKMGIYYTLNIPAIGNPRVQAIEDHAASYELIDLIKKEGDSVVIGTELEDVRSRYYLYKWLMTDDEYVYEKTTNKFMTKGLFHEIFGNDTEPSNKADASFPFFELGLIPGSTGNSFNSLKPIFDDVPTNTDIRQSNNVISVNLKKKISGKKADFVYLEFDVDGPINYPKSSPVKKYFKKHNYNSDIIINVFKDDEKEANSTCALLDGKLLIPVGENTKWITDEEIDRITIEIKGSSKELKLNRVEFYSLATERN